MDSLYILIPVAIFVVVLAILLFFWAVKSGQYDDLESQGKRILFDEVKPKTTAASNATVSAKAKADTHVD
ncbi:MAG: cbb3-type cytochrome oxidase assembly protein CcoS [Alteromonadaceae bacterium]|nr:MAG: cbb3-type cytochrome oxidase assembly protein CcoS [Alteromonadaceae bacterium]